MKKTTIWNIDIRRVDKFYLTKLLLNSFFLLALNNCFSQIQIGQDIEGVMSNEGFGTSTSISNNGHIIAVGAPNNVFNSEEIGLVNLYEFDLTNSEWNQKGQSIIGDNKGESWGSDISISSNGNIVAISSPDNSNASQNSGLVRIFKFDNNSSTWNQMGQDINGKYKEDRCGISISLNSEGNIIAIGSNLNDQNGENAGQVNIFEYDSESNTWIPKGPSINGTDEGDRFGEVVSLSSDGSIVAIMARIPFENGDVEVYEFQSESSTWQQIGQDINKGSGDNHTDLLSSLSISQDGKTLAIGASFNDDNGQNSGNVRVFNYSNSQNNWIQKGQNIIGEAAEDRSGNSISISGNGEIIAVGALLNDGNGKDSGHVRIYQYSNEISDWKQIGNDIDGEASEDSSGKSVSLSSNGNFLVIGAPNNVNQNGITSGHARIFELSSIVNTEMIQLSDLKINIHPNPASEQICLNNNQKGLVKIYNQSGTLVNQLIVEPQAIIPINTFIQGSYILEYIQDKDHIIKKFVISR